MNFLKNIFGKRNMTESRNNHATAVESVPAANINVMEDLFVDKTPPDMNEAEQDSRLSLNTFLDFDYQRQGYDEGYRWHSLELLSNRIRTIKSDFRYFLDQKIDEIRQSLLKFEDHKINLEGLSGRMSQQLQLRIEILNSNIQRLEKEKSLSAEEEGLIMKAINAFREGYIRGMERYQEEKIFTGSTGLFF